jgi:hypothetical protein
MGLPSKKRGSIDDDDDNNNNMTKKQQKRTSIKKQNDDDDDNDNNNNNKSKKKSYSNNQEKLEKALIEGRKEPQQELESQRQTIYNTLAPSYKQMFQTIVFAKWKKVYLPALILSPYSVPPGPVRTSWMERYEKVR